MPSFDLPLLGNLVLAAILVAATWTFALALLATRGKASLLVATRFAHYTTCALITLAVCLLAYAFQTHDFRLTYVARYSDRSMTWWYLVTSLWGGQDGSLLWWLFLIAAYTAAATRWLAGRLTALQPAIFATWAVVIAFFTVLLLFPANPFATYVGVAPADGEGLNPLLQNYWMTIHPPSLYLGFVGWTVPFGFVIAALASGRLDDEWLKAARPWSMIAWTFLSLGLLLGCAWSYEELGWGGYWAWDPVENASFMPWLVGTAYLHSAIVQERRGMLRAWNVFLLCLTFFMTIFGTWLTRSGLIASVHSFARSDIGMFFLPFMALIALGSLGLIAYRLPKLRSENVIDSLVSREFAFLFNNWILIAMMVFVLGSTTWPLLSEAFFGEVQTVGPPWYNQFMPFFGIVLLLLAGIGPLLSWRRSTASKLRVALAGPTIAGLVAALIHYGLGVSRSFDVYAPRAPLSETTASILLAKATGVLPIVCTFSVFFVLGAIVQEIARGARVRMRVKGESVFAAVFELVSRAKRTYGGYVVHAGIALMYLGFAGAAYDYEREAMLRPGGVLTIGEHQLAYREPRMEVDFEKRIVVTDLDMRTGNGEPKLMSPAKFIFRLRPEMPTTEPAIDRNAREDVYVIMSTVDPQSKRATFKVVVRPLVNWIWLGGALGLLGSLLAIWPDTKDWLRASERRRPRAPLGLRAALTGLLALLLVLAPFTAFAQGDSSSAHAGHVSLSSEVERVLFPRLLCQCGSCPRLPLDSCICDWASEKRDEIRERLAAGETAAQVQRSFAAVYGTDAISIPEDKGAGRALWVVPLVGTAIAALVLVRMARRWKAKAALAPAAAASSAVDDDRLDRELARLEEDDR